MRNQHFKNAVSRLRKWISSSAANNVHIQHAHVCLSFVYKPSPCSRSIVVHSLRSAHTLSNLASKLLPKTCDSRASIWCSSSAGHLLDSQHRPRHTLALQSPYTRHHVRAYVQRWIRRCVASPRQCRIAQTRSLSCLSRRPARSNRIHQCCIRIRPIPFSQDAGPSTSSGRRNAKSNTAKGKAKDNDRGFMAGFGQGEIEGPSSLGKRLVTGLGFRQGAHKSRKAMGAPAVLHSAGSYATASAFPTRSIDTLHPASVRNGPLAAEATSPRVLKDCHPR